MFKIDFCLNPNRYSAPENIRHRNCVLQIEAVQAINYITATLRNIPRICSSLNSRIYSNVSYNDIFNHKLSNHVFESIVLQLNSNNLLTHSDLHSYPNRNRENLAIPLSRKTKTDSSFLCKKFIIWNRIPKSIKSCQRTKKFRFNAKKSFSFEILINVSSC